MNSSIQFGNSRRLGRQLPDPQHWPQTLFELDEAILSWPQLSLHTTDIVFTQDDHGHFYVWREIIGHPMGHVLKEKQLQHQDICAGQGQIVRADLVLETDLTEVFAWAKQQLQPDASHCFCDENSTVVNWNMRQRVQFSDRDHAAAWWQLEVRQDQSMSSIFAF